MVFVWVVNYEEFSAGSAVLTCPAATRRFGCRQVPQPTSSAPQTEVNNQLLDPAFALNRLPELEKLDKEPGIVGRWHSSGIFRYTAECRFRQSIVTGAQTRVPKDLPKSADRNRSGSKLVGAFTQHQAATLRAGVRRIVDRHAGGPTAG